MSKKLFNAWLKISMSMTDKLPNTSPMDSPGCGQNSVDMQYVGDAETRVGYLDVWCSSCLHGIHISTVKVPLSTNMLDFDTPNEQIARRVPNFKQETP